MLILRCWTVRLWPPTPWVGRHSRCCKIGAGYCEGAVAQGEGGGEEGALDWTQRQGKAIEYSTMNTPPIYVSNCTRKSLWQKYEIFDDRLELHTWLGNFKVPFENIEQAEVLPPTLKSLRLHLKKCLPVGLKLDTSDFNEHILLDEKSGFIRHILFTPTNPAEFKQMLDEQLAKKRGMTIAEAKEKK